MIKINNTEVVGWEAAIRGMRNPMNSWAKSDSYWDYKQRNIDDLKVDYQLDEAFYLGINDRNLMMRLVKAGDEHAKFMRMIHVSMDILAPLYWWKQADTYKVGFVTNSCSTMHCIHKHAFSHDDFSCEQLLDEPVIDRDGRLVSSQASLNLTIDILNAYRKSFIDTKDKRYWWQMIQLLPDSYNQLRTCDTNYATLRKMYHQRKGHKLDEWHEFCDWIRELPYSELITGED